jgi:cytochrome oxidase Cu insertion factor (SCO1/SenC/PrrC family)
MSTHWRAGLFVMAAATIVGCSTVSPSGLAPKVGKAMEIEGADADGVPFKLSDYRGKVVLLDFWKTN